MLTSCLLIRHFHLLQGETHDDDLSLDIDISQGVNTSEIIQNINLENQTKTAK